MTFSCFSRNPIEKPSRLTPVGTKISLLRLQNHPFSLFSHVSDVFASKWHHKFTIWCPTIPFWTPKWSQTSSAGRPSGWPSLAGPGCPARPPGPACQPVGCSAGEGRGGEGKGGGQRAGEPRPPTPITAGGLFCMYIYGRFSWEVFEDVH